MDKRFALLLLLVIVLSSLNSIRSLNISFSVSLNNAQTHVAEYQKFDRKVDTRVLENNREKSILRTLAIDPSDPSWKLEIYDEFDSYDSSRWEFKCNYGATVPIVSGGLLTLMDGQINSYAVLWYNVRELKYEDIMIEVRYSLSYPSGATLVADGFAIAFYKNKNYVPSYGSTLGFGSTTGYGFEVDLYKNYDDPQSNNVHTAIIKDSSSQHLKYKYYDGQAFFIGTHTLRVVVTKKSIIGYFDSTPSVGVYFKYDSAIDRTNGWIGITASSSSVSMVLKIDYIKIYYRDEGYYTLLEYDEFTTLDPSKWQLSGDITTARTGIEYLDERYWLTLIDDDGGIDNVGVAAWYIGWNGGYIKYDLIIEAHIMLVDVDSNSVGETDNDGDGDVIMFYKFNGYDPGSGLQNAFVSDSGASVPGWGLELDLWQNEEYADPNAPEGTGYTDNTMLNLYVVKDTPNHNYPPAVDAVYALSPDWPGSDPYDGDQTTDYYSTYDDTFVNNNWDSKFYITFDDDPSEGKGDGIEEDETNYSENEELFIVIQIDHDPSGVGYMHVFVWSGDPTYSDDNPWLWRIDLKDIDGWLKPNGYIGFGAATGTASHGMHINYVKIYVRDTTNPSISITSPSEGAIITSSSVTVSWSASDDVKIDHYEIRVDDGSWTTIYDDSYTFSYLQDGAHTIYVRAYDSSGNYDEDSINIIVDTTTPQVQISSPINNSIVGPIVSITWSGSDIGSGIDYYEISIDDGAWIYKGTLTYHNIELGEGNHKVSVKAVDRAGYYSISMVYFYVDATPPSIVIDLPENNSVISEYSVRISYSSEDANGIDHFDIYLNDTFLGSTQWTFFDVTNLTDGTNIIKVVAYDSVGNKNSSVLIIIVDPSIALSLEITAPEANSWISGSLTIEWSCTALYSIDHFDLYINNTKYTLSNTTSAYTITLDDGVYSITLYAYDVNGHVASDGFIIYIDSTPPDVSIIYPTNGDEVNSSEIEITWSASDGMIAYPYVYISLDGGEYINVTGKSSFIASNLKKGWHSLKILAVDKAGNEKIVMIQFYVSYEVPLPDIVFPLNNTFTSNYSITIKLLFQDTSQVDHLNIYVDGKMVLQNANTGDVILLIITTEGLHIIEIEVYDIYGNSDRERLFIVTDWTPPDIQFLQDFNNTFINKTTIELLWRAIDNFDLDQISITVNDGETVYLDANVSNFNATLNEGMNEITITVFDVAGNSRTVNVFVVVDLEPPRIVLVEPKNGTVINNEIIILKLMVTDNIDTDVLVISTNTMNKIFLLNKTYLEIEIVLAEGENILVLRAYDKAGNVAIMTVIIYRSNTLNVPSYFIILGILSIVLPIFLVLRDKGILFKRKSKERKIRLSKSKITRKNVKKRTKRSQIVLKGKRNK